MNTENVLLMPFLDESPSFTNGFACGIIWEIMSESKPIEGRLVQAENKKQVVLMCEHFGYEYSITDLDEWISLTAKPIDITSLSNQ